MAADRAVIEQFLEEKRALITASSRNLGAAIATELATRGATVCIQYHASEEVAMRLVDELRAETGRRRTPRHCSGVGSTSW